MRTVWRLCSSTYAATTMSGEGARLFGGRWNVKGTPLVYCASSISLAVLETLVHSPVLPKNYVAIRVDVPTGISIATMPTASLPVGWQATPAPAALAQLGTAWANSRTAAALEVPSAIVEIETNVLINPLHPEASKLVVHPPVPFPFDRRLK